jgi:nitrite reductase/ring-hydroxylating ferredoxin subunit
VPTLRLSGIGELAHGETRKFEFEREGERQEGFLICHRGELFAYHNRCPHWGVDLDMGEGRFYSLVVDRIFCSSHGALFVPDSGYCDSGPCSGRSLERFEVRREGDELVIAIAETDPDPR